MKSKVFFSDTRQHFHYNIYDKVRNLMNRLNIKQNIKKGDIVAIKIHFGEYGNTGYIRPNIVRIVVDELKKLGAKPFLTDGSTLYKGERCDAVSHIETAIKNGFDYAVVNAPIIIADGLKGTTYKKISIDGRHYQEVEIANEIVNADYLLVLTHFKLHSVCAFGGSIKNVSMGLSSKRGKLNMHSSVAPNVRGEKCVKCLKCFQVCPVNAFSVREKSVVLDKEKCIGCGQCIAVCEYNAINVVWNSASKLTQEKLCEYAKAIIELKKGKCSFINFLYQITPECDCFSHSDTPIVQDIGILASEDAVAIDRASIDLLNNSKGLENTALKKNFEPGQDKISGVHDELDWRIQIDYSEKLGTGFQNYELEKIK